MAVHALKTKAFARWARKERLGESERDNIDDDELRGLKRIAEALLAMDRAMLDRAVNEGQLMELTDG